MHPGDTTTAPASPRARFTAGLLREHYEELEFLWGQRQTALESSALTMRYLNGLEERIEAHVQGLLTGGPQLPAIVDEGLTGDDPLFAFAAAYPLLRLGIDSATQFVMNAFAEAKPPALEGIRAAMCQVPITPITPRLRQMVDGTSEWHAVAASEILGFHRHADVSVGYVEKFCRNENPEIRRAAWHAAWHTRPLHIELYEEGITDSDGTIGWRAGVSAAWSRQKWLLGRLRELCLNSPKEHGGAVMLLAALGTPGDLERFRALGANSDLGPRRFAALASFGHPGLVECVLAGIGSGDPLTAVAAGEAFTRLTGANIESDKRATVSSQKGNDQVSDFDEDFADELVLPDPAAANGHWNKVKAQFSKSTRICRGIDLSRGASHPIMDQLDLKSRWEAALRGAYEGSWTGVAADLERLPQAHTSTLM